MCGGDSTSSGLFEALRDRRIQRSALVLVEVVSFVVEDEIEHGAIRELCRLVHDQPAILNCGAKTHESILLRRHNVGNTGGGSRSRTRPCVPRASMTPSPARSQTKRARRRAVQHAVAAAGSREVPSRGPQVNA